MGPTPVGTGITVEDARNAILSRTSPFGLHDRSVEQERVGKEDSSGKLTMRTHSWIMVPMIARAILGAEASSAFFPAFPADGSGRAGFAFSQAVHAVRTLLDRRLGIEMERDDIVVNPKDKRTLYFSQRLQDAVLNAMRADFSELFESLERWILMRFEGERQAVAGEGGGAMHTLSQMPVAPGARVNADAQMGAPPAGRPHGGGSMAECSRRGVSGSEAAAAAAGRASNLGSAHTPVGTGTVGKAAGDGGSGAAPLQAPAAPGAEDMLLLKALADAGINPRRVHNVRQPYPNGAALEHFQAKGIELAAAGVQRGDFANPAGHRWVLLAMPGEDQDERYAEAAKLFQTRDLGDDLLKPIEVCLASAEYSGVCVLARALLGSGLSSYALYADGFESLEQSQQPQGDFWIITSLDQTQTFRCVFRSLHQLLPIYTIIMSGWNGDRDGTFPAPANLGDSFSVPGNDCTDRDIHTEIAKLKLENSELEAEKSVLKGKLARIRRKRKCETNNAGRNRKRDDMEGCQRVTIAELAVGVTGLEGVELVVDSDVPALGGGSAAKKRPRRVQGEVAQDTLFIESKGGKAIRRATSGKKVGGLEWKDSVMAGAVASWALHSLSFKAAGKTVNAGLRIQGVRFWFKAEPRRQYKSRRRKNATPEIPLRDISTPSMRDGVFAMDLAKNSWFYEKLVKADAVSLCVDYGSVADKSFQASHLRTFRFQDGGTDGAGTMWLTVIADSMVLDVWPVGDKKLEEASYTGEAGEQRRLPVEAPRALAAQLIYAGIYWIIMHCRCLSLTFDGGGEGSGLGNKKLARENMAGKHSYMDLVWLERSAADSAFEMLNKVNLFVALMEFYGYDWEAGEFLTRRQDTKNSLAPEAEVTRQPSVRLDLTGDPESAADEARPPPRNNAKRPIFDPLGGPQDPATLRMSFFDFVVWDIARAYPYLGLAETARGVTEDMVARTESFMTCLLDAAFENVASSVLFEKTISADGFRRLAPGRYAAGDAVSFVMEAMTLAMGGRVLIGKGRYSDAPTPSPLIQLASGAHKIHVLDSFSAANMVTSYQESNIGKITCFFQSRRDLSAGEKPVALETDDTVFVCVHRPDHYVSMVVEHLGGSDDTARPSMTVADSCPSPSFDCHTHDALRIAFKSMKLIGKEHEVDHLGLALPQQTLPDCAFYMLIYLATVLTGTFLLPTLWASLTRLMRCWTFFLVFRELLDSGSIAVGALREGKREWERREGRQPPAYAAAADTVGPNGRTEAPVRLDNFCTAAKDAAWMEAAQKAAEQTRRKLLAQEAQARTKELGDRASKAWQKMERERPRQLDTSCGVCACSIPPVCARGSADSEEKWRKRYDPTSPSPNDPNAQRYHRFWPKDSMRNNPARYFPMAEQNQQNPNPVGGWCIRHRFQCACEAFSASQDNYSVIAEQCVTCVRNRFFWPRLKAHIQTYAGTETGVQPDAIHKEVRKGMRLRVDRCGPPKGNMVIQKDSEAPSFLDGLVSRMKKGIFTKLQESAETRWGTRLEGQWQLGVNGRALAAGVIQAAGDGTLEALKQGAAAPFQARGFEVDGSLRTTAKLGPHLRCLTSQKLSFYHAIGRFLCVFTTRPMLRAFSKDLECPASSVCGVGSYFRRLLHLVTDKMFVGQFNSADCNPKKQYRNAQAADRSESKLFTGTSHKFNDKTRKKKSADRTHNTVKLAHRGWTSMGGSHKSVFLLNPNVNVQEVLGPFTTPEMAGGVRDLICDLRRTAEMADELKFLPTLETRWEVREKARAAPATDSNWSAVVAAGKDKPVVNAGATAAERRRAANAVAGALYTRNMHKAQWAVREIMQDVVRAMEKWFDHELYSLFGFLACMIQTRWVDVQKVQTGEKMKILIAHEDAIPNGQVGSRILDELGEQLRHQGEQQFLEFYPPQLADMLKDEAAMRQLPIFLRGNAMEEFVLLDANGQVLLEDTKPLVKDANGDYIKQPVAAGPAPLWRFPELARRALKLYFCQLSSNDVERVLSLVARGYSGGGKNVGFRCISSWIRRRDWVSARFFRLEADPAFLEVYREARRLIRENNKGFQQAFALDINSSELRNRWRQQQNLPDYMKNGVRNFKKTNIVAGVQELMVGRKLDSNEQLSARVMNARKRQQIAARLKAIKRSHVPRPRATAAVVQRGKRKRTEIALPQYPQRSKRSRNDDADCGEDPNLVPAAHLNGMATVGTGITVEDARNAILSRTSPFGLHDRSVEQERVGKEDGSGKLTMRTLSWIMVPLIATAILGAEASAAFFPAFPADESGRAGFAFSKAVQAVRTLLDRRLGIEMELDDILVNPKDNRTLYFSQRLQNAVLNAMRAGFSELSESLQRWILERFEGERQAVAGEGGGVMLTVEIWTFPLTTTKTLIPESRSNRVKRVILMLAMERKVLILAAIRMIWPSNQAKKMDSQAVKMNVVLNDGRRFLMMALLLALELGLVVTPACSNFQAEALVLVGLLLLVLPVEAASVLILVLRQCRIEWKRWNSGSPRFV